MGRPSRALLLMWLAADQERRHDRPNGRMRRTKWPERQLHCVGCLAPLANGAIVCFPACDELWWNIVPTISGDLWEPTDQH
jgi:hypothetical protein